jgi:hypothetical protein
MSYVDNYDLPNPDPSKTILDNQQEQDATAKAQLAAALAKRIAEEEDQSGVRSPLRDMFNENGDVGLADAVSTSQDVPAPPDGQPLRITVTPRTTLGPTEQPITPGADITQDQPAPPPDLTGTIPDLSAVFGSAEPSPSLSSGAGGTGDVEGRTTAEQIDQSTRAVRQLARGALSTAGAAPWMVAAGLASIPGAISAAAGLPAPPSNDLVNWLLGRAENNKRFAEDVTGLSGDKAATQNAIEAVSKLVGENITPLKGATIPATAIASSVMGLLGPAQAKTKAEKEAEAQRRADAFQSTIETVGGPAKVDDKELYTLGGIALATMGMIFAPTIIKSFKLNTIPKLRPTQDASPGTLSMSNNLDRARIADDVNAGVLRLGRRAGIDPVTMKELETKFGVETRANAHALVDGAIMRGHMESPTFRFQAKDALANIARKETDQSRQYMHLWDTLDEIMLKQNSPRAVRAFLPGPPVVRGMVESDVAQAIAAMERAHPEVIKYRALYRDQVKRVREFAARGEAATISKSRLQHLNSERSNTTQFRGGTDDPVANLGSPTDNLATYMHRIMRERMENEAKLQYIDALRARNPDLAVPITTKEYNTNKNWQKNTVEIYRRGQRELYTTDPLIAGTLNMDPFFYHGGLGSTALYSLRRGLETTTTGRFAPWFSLVSATRNLHISRFTTPPGRLPPTILGTLYAIPQQVTPKMARTVGEALNRGSGGWLGRVLPQSGLNAIGARLTQEFKNSLVAQLEGAGSTHASILENQTHAITRLQHATGALKGVAKGITGSYETVLQAIHNAPMHNYASRNLKGSFTQRLRKRAPQNDLATIAAESRHLVGSPKVSGSYYTGGEWQNRPVPIRIEGTNRVTHKLTQGYSYAQQLANELAPWHNVTVQGAKRIMEAYWNNPIRFTQRAWTYSMLPAAGVYYYARGLGSDPNGVDYTDYMMNRRSDYAKQMYMYFPIAGRPVEDGIEIPNFHELAPTYRMMQVALDHATKSSIFTEKQDFTKAAASFFNYAIEPPVPPIVNLGIAGLTGMTPPMGIFGGDAYRRRQDPYDQTGGMPASLDTLARATAGGIADVVGHGYAAYAQTPEGVAKSIANFGKGAGRRVIEKTPYIRDITGIRPSATGNTPVIDALFTKQKAIDGLLRFFQSYGEVGEASINTKPASQAGGEIARHVLGEGMPSTSAGLDQPIPTNPLYLEFINEFRDMMKRDDPGTGGMGIRSMWRRYGDVTKQLRLLRNVNDGNLVTWQKRLEDPSQKPIVDYLKEYNVDTKDPRAVRNFFERQRQDIGKHLLFAIRGVEDKLSKKFGAPIKVEDLDPYGRGVTSPDDESGSLLPDPILEMQMYPNP